MKEQRIENQPSGLEINLQELLLLFVRKWWVFAVCCFLAGSIALTYAKLFITPMYSAGIAVYVNNSRNEQGSDYISSSDLSASSNLVNGYRVVVSKSRVLEAAAQVLDNDYTAGQLGRFISTSKAENTQIFYVHVTHSVPKEAARIANALAEVIPEKCAEIIEGSSARIIEGAKVPKSRISPSYSRSAMLGVMAGALLAVVILTITFLRDTRIKDEDELLALFELPILGRIPDLSHEGATSTYEYVKTPTTKEGSR